MDTDIEQRMKLIKVQDRASELVKELVELGNVMGNDHQTAVAIGMLNGLCGQHRTLQQGFVANLHSMLASYAETPFRDARNNDAVEWAKSATEDDTHFPFI